MILYSSVTGDPAGPGYFPMSAVRWLTSPRNIAALVTYAEPERFEAELFHFGDQARPMSAELYLLAAGEYSVTVKPLDKTTTNAPQAGNHSPHQRWYVRSRPTSQLHESGGAWGASARGDVQAILHRPVQRQLPGISQQTHGELRGILPAGRGADSIPAG